VTPKKKLSGATARKVTADWAKLFPELGIWKSAHLLRRVGPLAQGVLLERSGDSERYTPTVHIHPLVIPSPVIALGLMTRLEGGGGSVYVRRHEIDHEDAARRMREQSPLPFDGLTLPMVVDRLREQALAKQKPAGWADGVGELGGAILLAGVCGRDDLVEEGLELARSLSKKWQDKWYERWGEPADWPESLAEKAADRSALQRVVDSEADRHGLGNLPTSDLPDR
jgi:hypothetical protein